MLNGCGTVSVDGHNLTTGDPVITECRALNRHGNNIRTLNYIVGGSGGESSEGEFVEEEKPWPPEPTGRIGRSKNKGYGSAPRVPRPHSHLFRLSGRARASKHSRRWENSMFLNSLYNIPEEELQESFSILPPHDSAFTKLHTSDKNMQIWSSFDSHSEEEQQSIASRSRNSRVGVVKDQKDLDNLPLEECMQDMHLECRGYSVEDRVKRIEPGIRAHLRHNRHLPLDIMCLLEEELVDLFQIAGPHVVFLALQSNSFIRLLLHGLSQYLGLKSKTEIVSGSQVVVVEQEDSQPFISPITPLSSYLQSKTTPRS